MWKFLIIVTSALCCLTSVYGDMRQVAFYEVMPLKGAPPKLDGDLSDPAWRNLPRHKDYFVYFKPNPDPGKLQTEFMMTYDAKGIYLGIINYEKNMAKINRRLFDRDNPDIWQDDCGEIYFDPEANGIGYSKFTVNVNGAQHDMRRLDAAVFLKDWSGNGWLAKCAVFADRWQIEAFFPWEDLGKKAEAGDLWSFLHTRYGWADGFVGVTSAAEGNYDATEKFGYIYFSGGGPQLDLAAIGRMVRPRALAPWCLAWDGKVISCFGREPVIEDMIKLTADERGKFAALRRECAASADTPAFRAALDKLCSVAAGAEKTSGMRQLQILRGVNMELHNLLWLMKMEKTFN